MYKRCSLRSLKNVNCVIDESDIDDDEDEDDDDEETDDEEEGEDDDEEEEEFCDCEITACNNCC